MNGSFTNERRTNQLFSSLYQTKRKIFFGTNSNFLFSIFVQPEGVNLNISNIDFLIQQNLQFKLSKVYPIELQRYRDQKQSFGKCLISLDLEKFLIEIFLTVFFFKKFPFVNLQIVPIFLRTQSISLRSFFFGTMVKFLSLL